MPLLKIIQDNALATGNKCGLTVVELCHRSGLTLTEARAHLNQLFKDGKIKLREGIHSKLIFINQD